MFLPSNRVFNIQPFHTCAWMAPQRTKKQSRDSPTLAYQHAHLKPGNSASTSPIAGRARRLKHATCRCGEWTKLERNSQAHFFCPRPHTAYGVVWSIGPRSMSCIIMWLPPARSTSSIAPFFRLSVKRHPSVSDFGVLRSRCMRKAPPSDISI